MDTTAKKTFILFRRKDGNYGIVSSRAFFNKLNGQKAKQFLECVEINQSDTYEDLQAEIARMTSPVKVEKATAKVNIQVNEDNTPTAEEIEALNAKMSADGFKKTSLTKRDKEVLAHLKGGQDE